MYVGCGAVAHGGGFLFEHTLKGGESGGAEEGWSCADTNGAAESRAKTPIARHAILTEHRMSFTGRVYSTHSQSANAWSTPSLPGPLFDWTRRGSTVTKAAPGGILSWVDRVASSRGPKDPGAGVPTRGGTKDKGAVVAPLPRRVCTRPWT